ncbi:MAG: hypothetical protein R2828_27815 [Saprospiraceae bacterium]
MSKNATIILSLLLFAACGGGTSSGTATSDGTALRAVNGSAASPIPPVNSRETQLLAREYWVFEFYVVPNDRVKSQEGRGRWYKFYPDGRFDSGQWDKPMGSGSWGIGFRSEGTVLHIDSTNDQEDSEFVIQANTTGDEMSWVGTTTYGQDGIMLKAIHLLSQPTKAQFGLE